MPLPTPTPGLVIRYNYLWHREHVEGREEGQKDRPCAIVAAIRMEDGVTRVLVLPVTHARPENPDLAVELPPVVKQRLGMDEARSWVVVTEWNEFLWPGPDLRRIPDEGDGSVTYGMLPPRLFRAIRDRLAEVIRAGSSGRVTRT